MNLKSTDETKYIDSCGAPIFKYFIAVNGGDTKLNDSP